jgi:hypothetical protein
MTDLTHQMQLNKSPLVTPHQFSINEIQLTRSALMRNFTHQFTINGTQLTRSALMTNVTHQFTINDRLYSPVHHYDRLLTSSPLMTLNSPDQHLMTNFTHPFTINETLLTHSPLMTDSTYQLSINDKLYSPVHH